MRLLVLLFCLLICGCGQKGDLYLPDAGNTDSDTQEEETEETRKNNS